ncbi:hypothetical protein D3C80_1811310 [compost metagenome]
MARSTTRVCMPGTSALIMAISLRAALAPISSIIQAVLSTSRRACSISIRDSAIQSPILAYWCRYLPNALRSWQRSTINSRASSAMPIERMQ